jgi:predicted phosphohydrolase
MSSANIQKMQNAFNLANEMVSMSCIGLNSISFESTILVLESIIVMAGDICWDMSVVNLQISFALSCASNGGQVIASFYGNKLHRSS